MIDTFELADTIADQLGETEANPVHLIRRCVQVLGPERTQAFVDQALEVEAAGGMLLPDRSRRRTLGGVFFFLVREGVSEAERLAIFPPRHRAKKPKAKAEAQSNGESPKPMRISRFWLDVAAGKFDAKKWDHEVGRRRNAALNGALGPERGTTS
jgi:hypothetical protein